MKFVAATLCLFLICTAAQAQQTLHFRIRGGDKSADIPATITVAKTSFAVAVDSTGTASLAFPANGKYTLTISSAGFEEKALTLTIPHPTDTVDITLEAAEEEELEEVTVRSTRTSRTIANTPTRVETIEAEEIDEKNNMRPGNVAMLLHESTGLQVQQTSATSGNALIRIQGLDGRYTQLLKDGFATFGNFSSGLSVLEIPPLDLQQVEIIKGPASPLYGGGAIAGVINFISRTPDRESHVNALANASNIGQWNLGVFASGRGERVGYTVLAQVNGQRRYDVDGDHFTEVPQSRDYTLHPKLFLYGKKGWNAIIGNAFTTSERTGGDVQVVEGKGDSEHRYFERNNTIRNITTLELFKAWTAARRFTFRQSVSLFDRSIRLPDYRFAGKEWTRFTDASYLTTSGRHDLVLGASLLQSSFREEGAAPRDANTTNGGVYAQHTLDISQSIKLESGLRLDGSTYNTVQKKTEWFLLPRVSLFVQYSPKWSSRIGGGRGYKTPTLFTEQSEALQYAGIQNLEGVRAERSWGGTADVNYRTQLAPALNFSLNHLFFYTAIRRPLVLRPSPTFLSHFVNESNPVLSRGFETNAKFVYRDQFKLFLGYTYTHAEAEYRTAQRFLPLAPRHKLNSALIWEKEDAWKLGLEGYFTSRQYLSDGSRTQPWSELGFMAEKIFHRFSLYVNFENFTDTRQSRFKRVANGSHLSPVFDEIWTHTEGFVFNGGVKLRL